MSGRENFEVKARRYLAEGRLHVRRVEGHVIEAVCRGDSGELYHVGYAPGGWSCDCMAKGRCAHMQALMLVTLRPGVAA